MSLPVDTLSDPQARQTAPQVEPHFSLLRLSAGQRLAGVSGILVLLWLAVWWAL